MEYGSNKIKSFQDLDVWKEGHDLVILIYKTTKDFPKEEIFGIVNQMRRCAVSITSNIAEGFGRQSTKEKVQFFYIARGSLIELQNQLIIAKDVGYLKDTPFRSIFDQIEKVHKILNGLIRSTKSRY